MITAILPPFSLMAITGQPSYPLNSANASPPGICRVYLSCAEMALPPKTATTAAMIKIAENVVLFMTLSRAWRLSVGSVQPVPVQCVAIQFKVGSYLKGRTSPAGRDASLLFHAKFSQSMGLG